MVDWCRGFLGGFGLAGAAAHAQLSDEAQEVLRDLGHDRRLLVRFRQEEDEDEDALIEVQEFVRVAAMLLYDRVRRARPVRQWHRALIPSAPKLAALAIGPDEFARRRRQLMRMAGEDAVLLVAAAPERMRKPTPGVAVPAGFATSIT